MKLAICALVLALVPQDPAPETRTGGVKGTIDITASGAKLIDIGPVVVYLDAVEGALKFEPPKETLRMSQTNAKFNPDFLVVCAGQTVAMPNDDDIVHNVFSYSKGNEFDLGLYPQNESKSVTLKRPGLVNIYCSIHASMKASIYVAPSPWFARVGEKGEFEIKGVPPGKYKVKSWNKKLPEIVAEVEIGEGKTAVSALVMEAKKK